MFVPEPGNIRVLVYQLDEEGRHVRHTADNVVGHRSVLGRRRNSEVNRHDAAGGAETGLAFDTVHERLFVRDRSRILVFDASPDRFSDYPEAMHVIGQPDFTSMGAGPHAKHFPSGGELLIDEEHQRLFVEDRTRILVFDIDPDRLEDYPAAAGVIGQVDFETREPGLGRSKLARTHGIAFDPDGQRLFVSDEGNLRILVFDTNPETFTNGADAMAVFGQADFETKERRFVGASAAPEDRLGTRRITPGGLDYDPVHERLFVSQLRDNRILVFDASSRAMTNDPEAIAVLGQPDFDTFDPRVSRESFAFPKDPTVDAGNQVLYVSEGFPGGNRVMAFDIRPESLESGMPAMDVIGHLDDEGRDDFDRRMANDRLDARTTTLARAVALDRVDHRLWVADEYNNRVLGFQLDRDNRLLEREARWVFGQANFHSARADRSATGMNVPLTVAYDEIDKRLYIGDGWNDRVLIYDAAPERLPPGGGHPAAIVLGQPDFDSQEAGVTRNRFDFAVDLGRGIASNMLPVGIAIDTEGRRAFISDGGNNRVLVFDIERSRLRSGADAIGVIGQSDFDSGAPGLSARAFNAPGHLDYDPDGDRLFVVDNRNHRVLGFDTSPSAIATGSEASLVVGQPDYVTNDRNHGGLSAASLAFPNGVAYDRERRHLYVADQGNDRVLTFDAGGQAPDAGGHAFAVLGQRDFVTKSDQQLRDVSAQDQLYDPRGIAFDAEQQRLFVTDSHWARLLVFDAPMSAGEVRLAPHGARKFSSLDATRALGAKRREGGYGLVSDPGDTSWTVARLTTQRLWNELTEQESRMLVSHAAFPAPNARRHALLWMDGRNGARTEILIVNPNEVATEVSLTFRQGDETTSDARLVAAGAVERVLREGTGGLTIDSDMPVAATAFRLAPNRYGEETTVALPVTSGEANLIVPNLTLGAGYQSDVVLLNASSTNANGTVVLLDETGAEVGREAYEVPPGEHWLWEIERSDAVQRSYYARIQPGTGSVAAGSLVRRVERGLLSATSYSPAPLTKQARVTVDTRRDPIRHGRSTELGVVIANPGESGASVRFILRDLDGTEVDRIEQLFLPRTQSELTLGHLFDRTDFSGTIALVSDVEIAVSARQVTTNLRGDTIIAELPVAYSRRAQTAAVLPYVDGDGRATQWFVSGTTTARPAAFTLRGESGERMNVILR